MDAKQHNVNFEVETLEDRLQLSLTRHILNDLRNNEDDPLIIHEHEVAKLFHNLKPNKACGPDNITPNILKFCKKELSFIYTWIFNWSLHDCHIPIIWKTSKISPVPKSKSAKVMNDFRPIALTSVLMKCLEKHVLRSFIPICSPHMDPLQFAYKQKRSVEDAILLYTHNTYKHLDSPKCYVRTLFIDFSSAFNTIQPHILIPKLLDMCVPKRTALWIFDFLTKRPQFVFIKASDKNFVSSTKVTNTGAPQGTVLAPFLFSIYTDSCRSSSENIFIIKYADDTSIQALIRNNSDLNNFHSQVSLFVQWCIDHFLDLNVPKTKELIFDFRQSNNSHELIKIGSESVEQVREYKYLGVIFDDKLDWRSHCNKLISKLNTRMYLLRQLNSFQVNINIMSLYSNGCIIGILKFCLTAWGGNIRCQERNLIERVLKSVNKITKRFDNPLDFDTIFVTVCQSFLSKIIKDQSHPLFKEIRFSKVRDNRLLHLTTNTTRFLNSFLPLSIRNHNN